MHKMKIRMKMGEVWYGGHISRGFLAPLTRFSVFRINSEVVSSYNQYNTLLISNKGRYIWCESGYVASFFLGTITLISQKAPFVFHEGFGTLKGAYLDASVKYFKADGKMPNELMFKIPQYCTWIQFETNQNQEGILSYAKSILKSGMPAGELIIDDGWQTGFGEWMFKKEKFADPKKMIQELKELGFKVILWICPFISPTCADYDFLVKEGALVLNKEKKIAMREWWNGTDAVLDFSNQKAQDWFFKQTEVLTKEYGIDGFKQDAGDSMYYADDDITYGNVDANTQSLLWAESARRYDFNELRACFKGGGFGIAQRLCDKSHSWGFAGLRSLVPTALLQGIMGYPFTCPDMIGGGQMGDFRGKNEDSLDHELFKRYAMCSALMPMMQFSLNFWDFKNRDTAKYAKLACDMHLRFSDYIVELAKSSAISGEPIVRYLEYCFPNEGLEKINDIFMLGDKYLVAPISSPKGYVEVRLPKGKWLYEGMTFEGGKKHKFITETLVIMERI